MLVSIPWWVTVFIKQMFFQCFLPHKHDIAKKPTVERSALRCPDGGRYVNWAKRSYYRVLRRARCESYNGWLSNVWVKKVVKYDAWVYRTRRAAMWAPLKNKTPRGERGRCYPTPTASPRGALQRCNTYQTSPNQCHCALRRISTAKMAFANLHLRFRFCRSWGAHTPKRNSHRLVTLYEPAVILFSQRTPDRIWNSILELVATFLFDWEATKKPYHRHASRACGTVLISFTKKSAKRKP